MHPMFVDLFHLDVPVLEKVLRTVVVYAFLVVGLRLAGKRELAQLHTFDLVVLLLLSNTVQNAIIGHDDSLIGGLLGAVVLLVLNAAIVRFLFEHPRLDELVEGDPVVLIEKGRVVEERLRSELVTRAELERAAHEQGFARLDEVEQAEIDPAGRISFVARKPPVEDVRHREILARLDALAAELAALRAR
jgi:uncharacterized membrane protein YcaP (DUF421 family)